MTGPIRVRIVNPLSPASLHQLDQHLIQRGLDKHGLLPEEIFGEEKLFLPEGGDEEQYDEDI